MPIPYTALPRRPASGGGVAVLLITTRATRRWLVPKAGRSGGSSLGFPQRVKPSRKLAWEGVAGHESLGSFTCQKRLPGDRAQPLRVEVFPLRVVREVKRWPEQGQREKRWMSPEAAAEFVQEPELREILRTFAPTR